MYVTGRAVLMSSRMNIKKKKKQRNKKRRLLTVLMVFSLFLIVSVAYGAFQYESARQGSINSLDGGADAKPSEETEFNADESEKGEPINVLLVGIDTDEGEPARTDTIMIAQYNPKEGAVKIASIMRDSYVSIPGYRDNKINTSFFLGGPELLRKTIKENFDIDLHYYAMVNFDGFVRVVDIVAPNGVEVDIERRMYYQDNYAGMTIDFQPGPQTLDGEQALKYVRFRNDGNNDFGRVQRQQEMLSLLKDELLSLRGITRLPSLVGSLEPYVDTNLTTGKVLNYGKDFLLNPVTSVNTLTIPVEDGYTDKRYSHAGAVLELDFDKNKKELHDFFGLNRKEKDTSIAAEELDETEKEGS